VYPGQLGARFDAQLVDEPVAPVPVHGQRLGRATQPVQRQHQLGAQPLPGGVPLDQRGQLADQLGVPAQGQIGGHPVLDRADP
jgi:hypothetical protein